MNEIVYPKLVLKYPGKQAKGNKWGLTPGRPEMTESGAQHLPSSLLQTHRNLFAH